jgi:predicted Rossmann fold flavoprotein
LAGVALEVEIAVAASESSGAALSPVAKGSLRRVPKVVFTEDLLFTHRGLSGPAVLQASSYWNLGDALQINLTPGQDLTRQLLAAKHGGRRAVGTVLADHLPRRLVHEGFAPILQCDGALAGLRIADQSDRVLRDLATVLQTWRLVPSGTEGWRKAEVMRGGVATSELHPRTMEARRVPGLHFIGEVVDVTGWLGGYNFQWAWSSAAACAMAVTSGWDSRTAA